MQKENLKTVESYLEKILHTSLFAYLILLPFPHVTTIKEIAFWTAFLCWMVLRSKHPVPFISLNPITVSLSIFMLIALTASVIGIEPIESLKRFKGELLIPFILFLIASTEYSSIKKVKNLLIAPVIGFAIYTIFVLLESYNYGWFYFWDKTFRAQDQFFIAGYTSLGFSIFPVTLGIALFVKRIFFKYIIFVFAFIEFVIIALYRSFTPLIGSITVLLMFALFARPNSYRIGMRVFIGFFLVIALFLFSHNREHPVILEYKTKIFKVFELKNEIKSDKGLSARVAIWKASIDIIKDRYWLGYGWGLKRLKNYEKIVKSHLKRWKETEPDVYEIYKDNILKPHNIFLWITVQSGIVGLISFLVFIGIYIALYLKKIILYRFRMDPNFSIILIGGTLLSIIIMNMMNDELDNISGKIFFTVLGIGLAWINNKELKHSAHSSAR